MRRLFSRVAATAVLGTLVALGGLTAGCNLQWSGYAAKVGTTVIAPSELDAALKGASSNSEFRCLLERSSTGGYRLTGTGTSTYDSSFVAFVLTNLIDSAVARRAVESRGMSVPRSARALARQQIMSAFESEASSAECTASHRPILSGLGKELAGSFVSLQLDEDALAARAAHVPLSPAGLLAYEQSDPAKTKQACLEGLFVSSRRTGATVAAKWKAGASLPGLIASYAPQATAGRGQLGCYTAPSLTSISSAIERAVRTAVIGGVVGPVAYDGYYLVLKVTSRPFEPAVDALSALFTAHASAFSKVIEKAVSSEHIVVNPQYGRWAKGTATSAGAPSGFGGHVAPLKGPALSDLLNSSALRGPLEQAPSEGQGSP